MVLTSKRRVKKVLKSRLPVTPSFKVQKREETRRLIFQRITLIFKMHSLVIQHQLTRRWPKLRSSLTQIFMTQNFKSRPKRRMMPKVLKTTMRKERRRSSQISDFSHQK